MKKSLIPVCLLTLALLLAGCAGKDAKRAQNSGDNGVIGGSDEVKDGPEPSDETQEEPNDAQNGLDATENAAQNGLDATENAVQNGMDAVERGVREGAAAAEEAADRAADGARSIWQKGKDMLQSAESAAQDSALPGGMARAAEDAPAFEMVGGCSTRLYDKEPARIANINLAITKLNEMLLRPGETFSFNTVVGERSAAAGFQEARALWKTEATREIGGGVCQLSTTLYQAAQHAGLTVVERHPHQKPVNYVEPGQDACVDYGVFDLAFRNDTDRTVKIKGSCDGEYVHVTIEREIR